MGEKRPYKIVIESITQEKKKLRSVISYSETSPSGYTFVPVGAPELTEYCKELSRKRGLPVHVVSATPQSSARFDPKKISHHIHRVGHHFQNQVVETACIQLGLKQSKQGRRNLRSQNDLQPDALARRLDRHGERIGLRRSDNEIDPQRQKEAVSAVIKDLFPLIPEEDQEAIVKRAFEEGSDRIGTQTDVPLPRRVQLAVVAHIRHTKTDYDHLLKTHSWGDARRMVEHLCLEQIVRWRGEDEDDDMDGELEDIFQEVIVLDDDSDIAGAEVGDRDRESSIEIISSHINTSGASYENTKAPDRPQLADTRFSNIPEIISVKPVRANGPPPLITQEVYQQRFSDAKARVHESNAIRAYSKDRYSSIQDQAPQEDPLNMSTKKFIDISSRPYQQGFQLPPKSDPQFERPVLAGYHNSAPFCNEGTASESQHGIDYTQLHNPSLFESSNALGSLRPLRESHRTFRADDNQTQRRRYEEVFNTVEQSPESKRRSNLDSNKRRSLPMLNVSSRVQDERYRHQNDRLVPDDPSALNFVEVPSSRTNVGRTQPANKFHDQYRTPTMVTENARNNVIDLTSSPPRSNSQNNRYHPYERPSKQPLIGDSSTSETNNTYVYQAQRPRSSHQMHSLPQLNYSSVPTHPNYTHFKTSVEPNLFYSPSDGQQPKKQAMNRIPISGQVYDAISRQNPENTSHINFGQRPAKLSYGQYPETISGPLHHDWRFYQQ